jgi:Glycosyl transferase family 2
LNVRKLAGLAMVRNEADIIESFIRYNLQFLDEMIIVLHSPADGTDRIVADLQREGLPVVIEHNHELEFRKSAWMNKVARDVLASKRADFLFMLDADEFIKTPSREFLERAIDAIPAGATAVLCWESYVPSPEDATGEINPLKRIQYRCSREAQTVCKIAVGQCFDADRALVIAEGNHAVVRRVGGADTLVRHVTFHGLSLAHFPVRSASQLLTKAMIGTWSRWLQHGSVDKQMGISWHWLQFYQELMHGNISSERLRDLAIDYQFAQQRKGLAIDTSLTHDALPADFELKHTPATEGMPFPIIAQWVEQLIGQSATRSPPSPAPTRAAQGASMYRGAVHYGLSPRAP